MSRTAADLPRLLRQAWREAMTGSPRPAHLDLYGRSANVVETGTASEPAVADPALQLTMPPLAQPPSDDEIERAAAKLRAAKRISIVAGSGAAASGAGPELLALGETFAAPIGTSLGGRGPLIPTLHRLSIGCPGNYAAPPANQIVHEADLEPVGCHTGDQVTYTWRIPPLDAQVVHAPPGHPAAGSATYESPDRRYGSRRTVPGPPRARSGWRVARIVARATDGQAMQCRIMPRPPSDVPIGAANASPSASSSGPAPEVAAPEPATMAIRFAARSFAAARSISSSDGAGRYGGIVSCSAGSATAGSLTMPVSTTFAERPYRSRCAGRGDPVIASRHAWRSKRGRSAASATLAENFVTDA